MTKPRILAFAGSARQASFNRRLIEHAVRLADEAGATTSLINLGDYPLPLFNQDEEREHGEPENAKHLKALFREHSGLLISAPEYNSSITPLLKNTLDWVSRKSDDAAAMSAYAGKTAAIISASPGRLGGMRGLVHVRAILNNLGVLVLPGQLCVAHAGKAFDDSGMLIDEHYRESLKNLTGRLVTMLRDLRVSGS
jgi:NAD(P)H-dependent FMN reductase